MTESTPPQILRSDSRGRLSLSKYLQPDRTYRATKHPDGTVTLEPVTVLTEAELADLKEGLAQSARGETVRIDFERDEMGRIKDVPPMQVATPLRDAVDRIIEKTPPVEIRPLREGQPHEFERSDTYPECAVCGQAERTRIHVVKEDGLQVPMKVLKELAKATGMPGYIGAPKRAMVDWLWTYNPWKLADAIRGSQA
jgi:hypothetical protein